MHERIRKLRKLLDLTQQEFADKIGSKRNTIAKYETSANTPSAAVVSLICREFNVSETWLRTGMGEIFMQSSTFNLSDFAKSHGMTDLEETILKVYFELDPDIRKKVLSHFSDHLFVSPAASTASGSRFPEISEDELNQIAPPIEIDIDDVG